MIPVFHHCGLFTISNMEFLFSWVTNLYICNPPNSKIYLSNHNMEVHDTKNILIKCYPATNYLLWKHINKSPSAHLINLGSVSWKIPFRTFCKVKLLFSSLVKPTFQKSLQLPLTEFVGDILRWDVWRLVEESFAATSTGFPPSTGRCFCCQPPPSTTLPSDLASCERGGTTRKL